MDKIKISIITVSYNSYRTIERTINSVIKQTYNRIEYIIIDGGSSDGTIDIIKKYNDCISKWVSEPDNGLYDAMNKGIKMATGEVIGILNSDDCYHSNETIAHIAALYNDSPNLFVLHGNRQYHHKNGSVTVDKPQSNPLFIKKGPYIFHTTMFVPKAFYDTIGNFDLRYSIAADYDLILRLYLGNCPYYYFDETITDMYAGGASDVRIIKGFYECYQSMLRNRINPIRASYYFIKRLLGAKFF